MKERKIIRKRNHNYSSPGVYFVTICTQRKEFYFGKIMNGKMHQSEIGKMVEFYWTLIAEHFPFVRLGEYIIMPNHIHGIIYIGNGMNNLKNNVDTECRDVACYVPMQSKMKKGEYMSSISPKSGTLSAIIRSFKSAVTRWCNRNHLSYFAWQPRFYDRIIKNQIEYRKIKDYIIQNPSKWDKDEYFTREKI